METEIMGIRKVKTAGFGTTGFDILNQNQFTLNPENVRDFTDYTVEIEYDIEDGEINFVSQSDRAQELLDSLIYGNGEGNFTVNVNNPLLTSELVTCFGGEDQRYIVFAGNSRLTLIQNLSDAWARFVDEEFEILARGFSLEIGKLNYEPRADFESDMLFSEQIRDNSGVPLTGKQKADLICNYVDYHETEVTPRFLSGLFGLHLTTIYSILAYRDYPEWFKAQANNISLDVMRLIMAAHKAIHALDGTITLKAFFDGLSAYCNVYNKGHISRKMVEEYRKSQVSLLQPVEVVEATEMAEVAEVAEVEVAQDTDKPKTLKCDGTRVQELEDPEVLATVGTQLIGDLIASVEEIDFSAYDAADASKLVQAIDKLLFLVDGTKTTADKQAEELAKETAKAEKEAAKAKVDVDSAF